jgi:hypothetical protein
MKKSAINMQFGRPWNINPLQVEGTKTISLNIPDKGFCINTDLENKNPPYLFLYCIFELLHR